MADKADKELTEIDHHVPQDKEHTEIDHHVPADKADKELTEIDHHVPQVKAAVTTVADKADKELTEIDHHVPAVTAAVTTVDRPEPVLVPVVDQYHPHRLLQANPLVLAEVAPFKSPRSVEAVRIVRNLSRRR